MTTLEKTLMERDNITAGEAKEVINELKENMYENLSEGNIEDAYYTMDDVGLEPDYLMDLLI
jgi:hypothetical protein